MEKTKLCCYVDETGQDTYGRFFLVLVVLFDLSVRDELESVIEVIEKKTRKYKVKWKNTVLDIKREFLEEIVKIKELKYALFYSVYYDTKKYNKMTALTISKALDDRENDDYFAFIVIDGLSKTDMEKMRIDIKSLGVKYRNIRGMKDEQSAFLRLADAMAGFVRDYLEGENYTKSFFEMFERREIIKEV
jgi:hypothetical protein